MAGLYITGGYSTSGVVRGESSPTAYHFQALGAQAPWGLMTEDWQSFGDFRMADFVGLSLQGTPQFEGLRLAGSVLFFTTQGTTPGALKIIGGRQFAWNWTTEQQEPISVWGDSANAHELPFIASLAWYAPLQNWTVSTITLYVVPASANQEGFGMVGARIKARDLPSTRPYVTSSEWGDTTAREQSIGTGQVHTADYGWGFAQISIFLTKGLKPRSPWFPIGSVSRRRSQG